VCVCVYVCVRERERDRVRVCARAISFLLYMVAKTHKMPYLQKSFSAKEPYNQWLFCENGPAT